MRLFFIALISLLVFACTEQNVPVKKVTVEFKAAGIEPDSLTTPMLIPASGDTLYVEPEVIISNSDIDYASVYNENDKSFIQLQMNEEGTKKLAEYTQSHIGTRVAVLLDGKLSIAPTIRAALQDGKAMITGNFSKKEAEEIARGIMVK
jgi:preprotein translocase subunit SecD